MRTTGRGLRKLMWAFLLGYTTLHLSYSVLRYNIIQGTSSGDFHRVYQEATEWRAHFKDPLEKGNFHPPFYYAILLAMDQVLGGRQNLAYFFYFIQFILFPLAIFFLVRAAWSEKGQPPLVAYGIATVLTVNFQPFLETLAQHKVEGIEFFLICLAIFAFRRKRDLWCGGLLMLAANLKYLPALLVAHFGVKKEGKVLLGSLIGAAAVFAVMVASFGHQAVSARSWGHAADLLLAHKHEGRLPEASVEMQTLSGTVNRWFARPAGSQSFMEYIRAGSYMPVPNPALALRIAGLLRILAVIGWLFFIRHSWKGAQRQDSWPLHLLEISFTLAMIFVVSQASRVHYSILALPGFVIIGLILYQQGKIFPLREKCLFGLAYTLTGMLIPGGLLNRLPPHPVWGQLYSWIYLWWSLPFYGIVLLGICAYLYHRRLLRQETAGASHGR